MTQHSFKAIALRRAGQGVSSALRAVAPVAGGILAPVVFVLPGLVIITI